MLGLDLGTTLRISRVYLDGGLDAQALRFEGNIGSRKVGAHGAVNRGAGPDSIGVCIEEPFSGQFSSVKALFPMLGAAVLACELAGLPRSAIHLSKLKIHAIARAMLRSLTCRLPRERDAALSLATTKQMWRGAR